MANEQPKIALVVPCYNEEEVLPFTIDELRSLFQELIHRKTIADGSFLFFIDDGSTDKTWKTIKKAHEQYPEIMGIKLSANAGHQKALLAGMLTVKDQVDCIISLDADLQDDISIIPKMLNLYKSGYDIVYGIRSSRKSDSFFKRKTAQAFYFFCKILKIEIKPNHADFRLVSRPVLEALNLFDESNMFLRGIFPKLGFKATDIYYKRKNRSLGKTKYPLNRMLSFAWEGITSFSTVPLKIAGVLGIVTLISTFLLSLYTLLGVFSGKTVPGWASIMLIMLFLGSVQLICVSILGEYIGKIYIEVKRRPRFIIEETI